MVGRKAKAKAPPGSSGGGSASKRTKRGAVEGSDQGDGGSREERFIGKLAAVLQGQGPAQAAALRTVSAICPSLCRMPILGFCSLPLTVLTQSLCPAVFAFFLCPVGPLVNPSGSALEFPSQLSAASFDLFKVSRNPCPYLPQTPGGAAGKRCPRGSQPGRGGSPRWQTPQGQTAGPHTPHIDSHSSPGRSPASPSPHLHDITSPSDAYEGWGMEGPLWTSAQFSCCGNGVFPAPPCSAAWHSNVGIIVRLRTPLSGAPNLCAVSQEPRQSLALAFPSPHTHTPALLKCGAAISCHPLLCTFFCNLAQGYPPPSYS